MIISPRCAIRALILPLLLFLDDSCQGQVAAGDSSIADTLAEVIITVDRYPLSAREGGTVSFHLSGTALDASGGTRLGEALDFVRNLHVMRYGGGLSLQTVSMRGMGSEHTLMLLDGMPVQNIQNGVNDLRLIDARVLGGIEIEQGGGSALYGAGAVGGIISMSSGPGRHEVSSLELTTGIASNAGSCIAFNAGISPVHTLSLSMHGSRERARGNYFFNDSQTGTRTERCNQDFLVNSFTISTLWTPAPQWRSRMFLTYSRAHQGVPGPYFTGTEQGGGRQEDRKLLSSLMAEYITGRGITLSMGGLMEKSYERYLDQGGFFPTDNYYSISAYRLSVQAGITPEQWLSVKSGADVGHVRSESNSLDDRKLRNVAGLFAGCTVTGRLSGNDAAVLMLTPAGRVDWTDGNRALFNPKIGMNTIIRGDKFSLRVHSSLGRSVRLPTLNELYYAGQGGFGNPDLREESAVSYDAGLGGELMAGPVVEWDITFYSTRLSDRIVWLPVENSFSWSPVNIASSRSRGVECSLGVTILRKRVKLEGNYSTIDAKRTDVSVVDKSTYGKQLIYIPREKGTLTLRFSPLQARENSWNVELRVAVRYTGRRFILADNSESLAPYGVVDGTIIAKYTVSGIGFRLEYDADNIFRTSYAVVPNYPMPLYRHAVDFTLSRQF